MIDGNASDFIDKITFQEEAVIYKGKKIAYPPETGTKGIASAVPPAIHRMVRLSGADTPLD